jgi:hypothetical protein
MAFRVGAHVAAMADRLEQPTVFSESWTFVVPGATESKTQEKLDDFHASQVTYIDKGVLDVILTQ